ncbi:ribose ABC transporter permease [Paenibacillus tyrfis]|uniref:ABC transporter permease subunit n=1 Tax=Paenibacillus TaxID=44249 RepID=UPI002492C4AE|nr:ribose ABC transporter permease [Paenibacillus tyrfis]GLI04857.1 ribose ABC transporter permease [Paenibacillus tyrfis]GMX62903.1 ribose ABC transporter permease [Paenibacillus elgii]
MKTNIAVSTGNEPVMRNKIMYYWNQLGMLIILVLMCVLMAFITPNFMEVTNIINVLKQVSITAILAAGMTVVILTGGIDLSVGSTLALSGVLSVMLTNAGVNPVISMLAGAAAGYVVGAINGYFTAAVKLPPFIVTLGSMTYVRGLAYVISGGYPIVLQDVTFKYLGAGYFLKIPTPIYIMALVYVVMYFILKYTMFGRHIYAIGGNQEAARLTGIKVEKTLIHVYSISGFLAGAAGVVMAGRLFSGQPMVGVGMELDAIAAVILGGTSFVGGFGRIQGTIIGVLTMGVLTNGLTLLNVDYYWQLVVKGAVIVVAVLLDRLRSRS